LARPCSLNRCCGGMPRRRGGGTVEASRLRPRVMANNLWHSGAAVARCAKYLSLRRFATTLCSALRRVLVAVPASPAVAPVVDECFTAQFARVRFVVVLAAHALAAFRFRPPSGRPRLPGLELSSRALRASATRYTGLSWGLVRATPIRRLSGRR